METQETVCKRCGESYLRDGYKVCPDCRPPEPQPVDCYRYTRGRYGTRIEEGFKYQTQE